MRIVELEGPFIPAVHLFPDATPELIEATATARNPRLFDRSEGRLIMAFHSFVVRTPGCTILVDSCVGNDKHRPRNPHWHQLSGSYLGDLAAAGLRPEDIDIVMCTHLHADHVGWNTRLQDGRWVPTFPNARYLFGRTEVEHWRQLLAQGDPDLINHRSWADSVEPVFEAGQAVVVNEDHEVGEGVQLMPAPGHTPGNVMVRIDDGVERAYLTGDVIHHPIQVEHPEWSTCFCSDPGLSAETRRDTLATVAEQDAWLLAAHFPSPTATRVRRGDTGFSLVWAS